MLNVPSAPVARLRDTSGQELGLAGRRWTHRVDPIDLAILQLIEAPVLDLGCGPGRHTQAIAEQGRIVLGVDLSGHAVQLARSKGLSVLERSVFDDIPKAGQWQSALLLDGNIGIGGDPVALLSRVANLLTAGGQILVELVRKTTGPMRRARLEIDDQAGPWFDWIEPGLDDIPDLARFARIEFQRSWTQGDRHFALLVTP